MKNKLLKTLDKFFFEPVGDVNFGVSRFLFFWGTFVFFAIIYRFRTTDWLYVDRELWAPVSVFKIFNEPLLLTPTAMEWVDFLFPLSLLFSALGLFSRISFPMAFLTGLYVLGLSQNFGKVHHSTNLPMLMLFVFCFVKFPGRFSLDYLLFKKWIKIPKVSFEYKWPLSLCMTLIALTYSAAGFQKFRRSGFDWALSDSMEIILLTRTNVTDLARWVVEVPYLAQVLALMALIFQLGGLLFLLVKPLRIGFVFYPIFHLMSYFLLGVDGNFNTYLPVFMLLVPWDRFLK